MAMPIDLSALGGDAGALLKERRQTIAVVESSAGGLISAALVAVPGASAYYLGGTVVYTAAARSALLAISREDMGSLRSASEPYALLIAQRVRAKLGAGWGLSETGASGPSGNRYGDAPGHACIAVCGPIEKVITVATGSAEREANMLEFARRALALLVLCVSLSAQAFDLQGHRGARGLWPENTLPAFAAALTLGVTTLELDTGITRDGVVVVHHDRTLNPDITRGPDGRWLEKRGPALRSMDYAELQKFDVGRLRPGSDYGRPFATQQPVDGTRIPKLAEVFALARKAGNELVRFNIETKLSPEAPDETLPPAQFARAVVAEIRKAGVAARSTIQSFDWRTLAVVQAEAPDIATVYLTGQEFADPPSRIRQAGGGIWSPNFNAVRAAVLKQAHAQGLQVIVWTVNEPAHIAAMLDLGVDGIISDRPDLVRAEMTRRGMKLPAATPVSP